MSQIKQGLQKSIFGKQDPQFSIQKLMSQSWDHKKYINTNLFAKQNFNIVFIGHVDAGKSTFKRNIMKQSQKIVKKSNLAYYQMSKELEQGRCCNLDVIEEQAEDQIIQCASSFQVKTKRFTVIDTPRNKNFVPNMILNACHIDIAVLVISAKEGQFESGFDQYGPNKQQAMLVKALGATLLIVAVNKMGAVAWSQKRYHQICNDVSPYLKNVCGFNDVAFIPIESVENANIHQKIQNQWYKGPCFLEYLQEVKLPKREPLGPLRIPIMEYFKEAGNHYVKGKIQSGAIIEEQTVTLLPKRIQLIIEEIYNIKRQRLPCAIAGENVKIKVKETEENIFRGDIICNNICFCQQSSQFKAVVNILGLPENKKIFPPGYQCIMHLHVISIPVQILGFKAKIDKQTGKKTVATFLKSGQRGICVIKIQKPVCLQKFQFIPSLGKFTLRDQGKTIGYGQIIGIKPAANQSSKQKQQGQEKIVPKVEQENVKVSIISKQQ